MHVCQAPNPSSLRLVAGLAIRHTVPETFGKEFMKFVDVAIVGAGVVGSSTAYHLLKHGFAGKVAIIERDTTYAFSCTARAVGGLRQQFSCPENIALSQFGLAFIRRLEQEFGPDADVGFRERGYLLLASDQGIGVLKSNVETQRRSGADVALLSADELKREFSWLETQGIAAGVLSRSGEGWLDPETLMNLLRRAALARGAELVKDEVVGIDMSAASVAGLALRSGERMRVGALVNAAGAGAGALAAMAGIDLPVGPRKRYVYVLDCPAADESLRRGPLFVDASGFYLRPEGRHFVSGLSPAADEEPADLSWDVDYSWFEERIWPLLAARIPAFEALKVVNGWVGHYDYNAQDENGIIGRHPNIANFYFANGFSGHGMQQAPAVGNAIAELIIRGRYETIDLHRLGFERIMRGERYGETNII
jgi:FAD-dependent oxidoreductase domain-containing protein 1